MGDKEGAWQEKGNPKKLLERRWGLARRRQDLQGTKAAPCPGIAEGWGEAPELVFAVLVPWGGMLGRSPRDLGLAVGGEQLCVPSAWKSAPRRP